ncbi:MAG TPA: DUF3467 domain-containing protein [Anaerolineaceae bacterium]|mgnify:FL=1|nr:DUF3467 domain-containing protein [Chloroflexota bacterium]HNY83225.1 DUF3467 domain-containing protein [Anaerolineaceae bacterium]
MSEAKPLNVVLPEDLKAQFVNMVRIAHTPGEFVLDFTAVLPGVEDPKVSTRVILSPLGMKLMQHAITDNLRRYEATFGEIRLPSGHTLADDLFRPCGPQTSGSED